MFTGIIEDLCEVINIDKFANYTNISISSKFDDVKIGASIAVNGACLTVVNINEKSLSFDVINETLEKTNLKFIKTGDLINIERCMRINDRIDGHIVQGHIECLGELISKISNDGETNIKIKIDNNYMKYCIYKGSIALDGISLTISKIDNDHIECSIIPHTLNNTTLKIRKEGDMLNIETDMISKYIEKQLINKNI
mgnify:FL=1